MDATGRVYVSDEFNLSIRMITSNTNVYTVAGNKQAGYSDDPQSVAKFNRPQGICFDTQGNLYVADLGNHRIRMVTPAWYVYTIAGSGAEGIRDGSPASAEFYKLSDIAVDRDGNLSISDGQPGKLRKITVH